jgi:hypothetical protein
MNVQTELDEKLAMTQPQGPIEAWRERILRYAGNLVESFASTSVGRKRVPFDDNSMMDPPFKATLIKHCVSHHNPADRRLVLIVLTDWWKSLGPGENGTVDSNVEYFERCFRGEDTGDLTYRQMFDNQPPPKYGLTRGWVRNAVGEGEAIITNAVLGMRDGDSAVGDLDPGEHYTGMIEWWLPLAQELRPSTVFLCGNWAITRLNLPDGHNSTPKVVAEKRLGSSIEVKHLPHPGSWRRKY